MPDQTPALRPINRAVQRALGEFPAGPFNFGLYFHKWFHVVDGAEIPQDNWKRSKPWACTMADETKGVEKNQACPPNKKLDNFDISLGLFNGSKNYRRTLPVEIAGKIREEPKDLPVPGFWDRQTAATMLKAKHHALEDAAQAFRQLGYEYDCREYLLETPLVLGLGDEHPTEKGFRFHWTLGIPFIPASSLKGVVRLAWLVAYLNSLPTLDTAADFCRRLTNDKLEEAERLPEEALALFGCGGDRSRRGQVIFLDAYPAELPRLKAEIMTCHYRDYYEGKQGPTEDQQPNPQKFWAVDPFLDEAGKQPLTFVFRLLLAPEIAQDAARKEKLLQAVEAALGKHGLGAKTAIGHGRFRPGKTASPPPETEKIKGQEPPAGEVWERASLSWDPGSGKLTATRGKDKAYLQGKEAVKQLLPADLFKKVVEKRKTAEARVTVQDFRITKAEPV